MNAAIDYRPELDRYNIYLGTNDAALYIDNAQPHERLIKNIKPGDERPVFLSLHSEEYTAIRDAILLEESGRLADAGLLRDRLDRADELTDRLLTMLEQG